MANNKKAWYQGSTESADKVVTNDPNKLGKDEKYPRQNPPVGDVRNWEQSAFEAAARETKKNLGPSGAEFKLKQDWQRIPSDEKIANASLSVGLTKHANPAKSVITVYAKDKAGNKIAVVKASLAQIWAKNLNAKNIAKSYSEDYAKAIIAKIRKQGFSKVAFILTGENGFAKRAGLTASFVKKAQMAAEGEEFVEMEDAPEGDVTVLEGDINNDEAGALDSEVAQTGAESEVTVDLLAQKMDEVESAQTQLVENTAPESTSEVFVQLQDAEKMLNESKEEMSSVAAKLKTRGLKASQKIELIKIAAEAQNDAVAILEGSDDVLAKAQQAVEAAEAAIEAAEGLAPTDGEGAEGFGEGEEVEVLEGDDEFADIEEGVDSEAPVLDEAEEIVEAGLAKNYVKAFLKTREIERKKAIAMGETEGYEQGKYNVHPDGSPKDGAAEISSAHPDGGAAVSNLTAGGKPENDGEVFETVTEAQEKDMKATNKMPTGNLSSRGAGKGNVKTASADSATAEYWSKELFGQGDATSKEYGKDMSKEYSAGDVSKAAAASASETKAKVVRAYELAEVAAEKGFCDRTASAKGNLVNEILAFDDNSFLSFKKMLDKAPTKAAANDEFVRTASAKLPRIGQKEVSAEVDSESGFINRLSNLGWSK